MAARAAWAGAITFGVFPINVVAFSLLNSPSAESFKGLCSCHHAPVTMPKRCSVDDTVLTPDQIVKGVTQGRGKNATYVPLPTDAVQALTAAESSQALEILRMPKADGVPWHLATGRYRLVPDPKVAGSEGPCTVLWNGLYASGRAIISEWSKRAGTRPVLCAVRADEYGLTAIDLPYATSLKVDAPEHRFEANEQAQQMFETFVGTLGINTDDFTHAAFTDTYAEKRAELVAKALAGEQIEVVAPAAPPAAAPDLMAAMAAALANAKPPAKGKGKAKAAEKVAA